MMPLNSGSTADWTGSTGSKSPSRWRSRTSPTQSASTQGGFSLVNFQWASLPLAHRPFSSLRSSPLQSLFVAGCEPRGSVVASTDIASSCLPSLPPSCQGRFPEKGPVSLSPEAPAFIPRRRLSGSGHPQVGQVCRVPTSQHLDPLSSWGVPPQPLSQVGPGRSRHLPPPPCHKYQIIF